jgi:putative FmdB family regulatory protein
MVLNDFQCGKCHSKFEQLAPAGDPTTICPYCNGTAHRVFTTAHVFYGHSDTGIQRPASQYRAMLDSKETRMAEESLLARAGR